MKIDLCIVSSDNNENYYNTLPILIDAWNMYDIPVKMILISNSIPESIIDYSDNIILFPPIPNVHSCFVSQCIRILYPCLFDNKNIIISDADIFPLTKEYIIEPIKDFDNNYFISYTNRYNHNKQQAICYNVANSEVWKDIFNINSVDDIINTLKFWYNKNYNAEKNCPGWFTDQEKLFEYLDSWTDKDIYHKIFTDDELKFKRIDKRNKDDILGNRDAYFEDILNNKKYTDYHFIKPFLKYKKITNSILHYAKLANKKT